MGPAPVYTINATEPAELAAGIEFAQKNNVRLVIRNTGHDMLGKLVAHMKSLIHDLFTDSLYRSEGYAGLQIWIKYIQKGIDFHETYAPSDKCGDWTGSALTIGGGYVWEEAHEVAFKNNVTVVGGGDPVWDLS